MLSLAAQPVEVGFDPSVVEVQAGGSFTASLFVDPQGRGISACEIKVTYDPDVFKLVEVELGGLLGEEPVVGVKDVETPGVVFYAVARRGTTSPPTPKDVLLTLSFEVCSEAPSGPYVIKVESATLVDENFQVVGDVELGYLVVNVSSPPPSPGGGCLVATAAFGSELAEPVQLLRCFRDYKVMNTRGGSAFMEVFNAWYYSWSPYVASVEYSNDGFRTAVRYALYPLIGSLMISQQVYDALSWYNAELAIVAAGVVASIVISLIYITPFTFLLKKALRMNTPWARTLAKVAALWLVGSLAMHLLGLLLGADLVLRLSSTCIVLASMTLPPSILALRKAT